MGKRKRATKPPPKKKAAKLEKVFNCPFCGHEESVECKISKSENTGSVECRLCGVRYSTTIGRLEEEIDVYYKWIDACDAANRAAGAEGAGVEAVEAVEGAGVGADEGAVKGRAVAVGSDDEGDDVEGVMESVGRRASGGREGVKVVVDDDDVDDEAL
ncbi:unnamed protein product [Agarophyton chilense]